MLSGNVEDPKAVLFEPVVLVFRASNPKALLLPKPEAVLFFSALTPKALFCALLLVALNASRPTTVLSTPVLAPLPIVMPFTVNFVPMDTSPTTVNFAFMDTSPPTINF